MTFQELHEAVEKKEIISATTKDKRKYRLFHANNGALAYFGKGKSRSGNRVTFDIFSTFEKFQYTEVLTDEQKKEKQDKKTFNLIAKFRKLAAKAKFTNDFIVDCLALPETFEQWVKDGKKDLFEYHITTGSGCDGKVVTIDRIARTDKYIAEKLRQAIEHKMTDSIWRRFKFAGYEASIETKLYENGMFKAWLSLEYAGCANGHYYILINENEFIGIDTD